MSFVSALLVSCQPFVSYYPPQQKETYTPVSYKIAPQLHGDGGTVLQCWACTKIPELEAHTSFCWTHRGRSNQAELLLSYFLTEVQVKKRKVGKAPSVQNLQQGTVFRTVYLALKSGTAGTVSVKAVVAELFLFFSPEQSTVKY